MCGEEENRLAAAHAPGVIVATLPAGGESSGVIHYPEWPATGRGEPGASATGGLRSLTLPARHAVKWHLLQDLPDRLGQCRRRERFLEKGRVGFQDAVTHHSVIGVAGQEQHLRSGLQRRQRRPVRGRPGAA